MRQRQRLVIDSDEKTRLSLIHLLQFVQLNENDLFNHKYSQ